MHTLKLTQIGNSVGVILPKELVAKMGLTKGDTVYAIEQPDGVRLTTADPDFEAQMDWLRNHRYHPITMRQLQAHRERGEPLPPRPVMITFDDGWGEDMWIARRFLDPRGMPTVFFVYTGAVGAPGYLSWSDAKSLEAAGHEVLSHTVSHPDLQQVPDARLASEMRDSRARLERELGHPIECIAYPFGSYDGRVVKAASNAGYRLAVIADGGDATDASPALELPRWKMGYGEPLPLFVQRLHAP